MTDATHTRWQEEPPWMTRIRLRAQRRILWMRSHTPSDDDWPDTHEFVGNPIITDNEVNRILADPQVLAIAEAEFYEHDDVAQSLNRQIKMADDLLSLDIAWQQFQQIFALSPVEQDLLSLTLALEVDPSLRRVYGYLHDDATMTDPTVWLGTLLFHWPATERVNSSSSLVRWQLAYPIGNSPIGAMTTAWRVDPAIALWLLHHDNIDPKLGGAISWLPISTVTQPMCLYPDQRFAIQEAVIAMAVPKGKEQEQDTSVSLESNPLELVPLEIELVGAPGTGKRTLAMQVCAELNIDLMAVDASQLLGSEVPRSQALDHMMRVTRLAKLSGAMPYWYGLEDVSSKLWSLNPFSCDLTFLGGTTPLAPTRSQAIRQSFHLPQLTRSQQGQLWQQLTHESSIPDAIVNWQLTPAEIHKAALVASAGSNAVTALCRQMLHQQAGELFSPLVCPYTWADIVLPEDLRQHLQELEQQAKWRWQVYEDWGFKRLYPLGQGMTALFAGPSGTGKTMAAQVLARTLEMDLYRVDLAGVVNKYIGETEKRLKQVFDACERANVLLFFDEADALFGQRTQVKDAHDRFANIEIDYLLQRMEQFNGLAILATNRKSDLDQAFLRRIRFIVDFVPPGPEERVKLWRLALPDTTPLGDPLLDEIDWEFLATRLTMTGADIKAAALGAAFLARSQNTCITMQQVLHAAQRVMAKHGTMIRIGEWEAKLKG